MYDTTVFAASCGTQPPSKHPVHRLRNNVSAPVASFMTRQGRGPCRRQAAAVKASSGHIACIVGEDTPTLRQGVGLSMKLCACALFLYSKRSTKASISQSIPRSLGSAAPTVWCPHVHQYYTVEEHIIHQQQVPPELMSNLQ